MEIVNYIVTFLCFVEFSKAQASDIQDMKEETNYLLIQRHMREIELLKTKVEDQQKIIENLESKIRIMEMEKESYDTIKSDTIHTAPKETASSNSMETATRNSSDSSEGQSVFHNRNALTQRIKKQAANVRAAERPVAFYAFLTSGENNPGKHHTLLFDSVKIDNVTSYNKYTGAFIVPVQGLYVFTTTIFVKGYMSIDILVNNAAVNTIFPDSGNQGPWVSTTGIAVVNVNAGDVVTVRTRSDQAPHGSILCQTHNGISSFSGWMITI